MNDFETQPSRMPVIAQLSVLGVILFSLFGTLLFISQANTSDAPVVTPEPHYEPLPPVTPQQPMLGDITIEGTAAFVWDAKSSRALYKKNPDAVLPLASITKLMTSLLTEELFDPEVKTTLSQAAISQSGDSGLAAGEKFTTEDLRTLALISSSNDAAFALGASVGSALGERNPTAQFVTAMNIRAEELGFDTLEFKNTTGLDLSISEPGAVGSARDITFLMEYIISEYPELLTSTTETEVLVYNADGVYHEAFNTNQFVTDIPNLIGSKTGYTDLAGGNLTVAFDAGLNHPVIITVLGSTRAGRFEDVERLVSAVQASFNTAK